MINDVIKGLKNVRHLKAASAEEILEAQEELEVAFSEDYKDYLGTLGLVSAQGIELTGITDVKWLNVVDVTKKARQEHRLPLQYYVIESLRIDDWVAVQSADGQVYLFNNGNIKKAENSLSEYLLNSH